LVLFYQEKSTNPTFYQEKSTNPTFYQEKSTNPILPETNLFLQVGAPALALGGVLTLARATRRRKKMPRRGLRGI
jgi:hypothetical protein